jgi:hypothetical protein
MPRALASEAAREIRHSSLCSTGRRTYELAGPDGLPLVVKCYPGAWWEKLPSPDGSSLGCSPWGAFECNLALSLRGVPVPQPLAFVAQGQNTPDAVSYAITSLLEGCQPLMNFAFEHLRRRPSAANVTRWMEAVVETIVNLHRAGYAHGDLHHHNILIRSHDDGEAIQVYLISTPVLPILKRRRIAPRFWTWLPWPPPYIRWRRTGFSGRAWRDTSRACH